MAAMAERLDEIGKARDVAAARQEFAKTPQEDHHGQRDEDRVRAGVGDDGPHDRPAARADADGQDGAENEGDRCWRLAPPLALSTHASVSPQRLAVKVTARLMPPADDRHQHGQR